MKVFLETYGCQMNEYDSELIRAILQKANYEFVASPQEAEVAFLNTCAVRESAQQKIYQRLHELKKFKKNGQLRVIGVVGCMAQSLRQSLTEMASMVDIVAGPDSYKRLPALLQALMETGEKVYDFSLSEYEKYDDIVPSRSSGSNAWIAIMRGCNNFCSFCVVPYTRGRERSRPLQSVIQEAERIVAQGFKQITLLGQNVNSYRYDDKGFAELMEEVSQVSGLRRVYFTSPHPKDFSHKLLEVMAAHDNLCKYIHLPLQAGSDAVLTRMNRHYTGQHYIDLVQEIRTVLPGVALTTDIICGFCGETEEDFSRTLQVMERVCFDSAFIFKYSQRPNTIAAHKYQDDITDEVKTERVMRANELQRKISLQRNQAEVGNVLEVLLEEPSKKSAAELLGRTANNKGVVVAAPQHHPGDFVHVRITEAGTNTLRGILVV